MSVGAFHTRLALLPAHHTTLAVSVMSILALALVYGADHGWHTSYTPVETLTAAIGIVLAAIIAALLVRRVLDLLSSCTTPPRIARALRLAYLGVTCFALYRTHLLAHHGRYVSFPIDHLTVPVLGLVGLLAARLLVTGRVSRLDLHLSNLLGTPTHPLDRWLGWTVAIAIAALISGETYAFFEARDLRSVYPTWSEALPVALRHALGNSELLTWVLLLGCLGRVLVPVPARR
jgi:hypothetical protein